MTIDELKEIITTATMKRQIGKDFAVFMLDCLEELETLRYCKDKWNENQYQQGISDGARDFAEWLSNTEYVTSQGHFILPLRGYFTVDEVVSEWRKEQKNDN